MSLSFIFMGYLTYPKLLLPQIDSFNIPIDHKSYTNVIEFGDKVLIDGDLFQANGDINGKSYKVFYKLKNEHEKNKLLNTMPFMKNCIITYNKTITLPNTNNLKFNYNEYLLEHEIDGVLKLKNFSVGSCKKRYLYVIEKGQLYRERLIQNLKKLDVKNIDDIIALTLGETRYLSSERIEQLKNIGIYHLYAVSGSHVALVNVFLFRFLLRINVKYNHAELIIFIALPLYAILTGLSPSVLRAVGVVMVYMVIKRITNIDSLQILSITFILYTLYNPYVIFDIGFQLSYIISTFILLCIPIIKTFTTFYKIFTINIISQLSSFIILILHFNTFQWLGFISNFIFIPLFELIIFPLVMTFLIIFIIFKKVPFLLSDVIETLLSKTIDLIEKINNIPINDLVVRNLDGFLYFLIFIVVVSISILVLKKHIVKSITIFSILILAISIRPNYDRVILKFLDIGQGDAMIAYHQDVDKVVMIDTGGKDKRKKKKWQIRNKEFTYTDSVLVPELHENGYNRIDYLIISHPHADHMGELSNLIKKVEIKNLVINQKTWDSPYLKLLISEVANTNTNIIDSRNINKLKIGESIYQLYNNDSENHEDKNDTSIVTEIKAYNKKILATGDATERVEHIIISDLKQNYDLLKVGHHGSSTSTSGEFLYKVNPKLCVISSGRNNRYGLPSQKIVKKLEGNKCKVFNTQDYGVINFVIEENSIRVNNGLNEYNKKAYKNH
ncbi:MULTISPECIES: DNA internalization-related competence protein ComEC/Rec2 [Mammaliicoccus]|uniref:DNA internalization-related competence protein ComEC/Rec2 n=2 Tax=Staphylococcaceae TaxID=90964 RepID=UPI001EFB3F2D|nr:MULTISPECIES: DNA internalization-related competence protein ComEC/Rec2 [Mammaliicoccus]